MLWLYLALEILVPIVGISWFLAWFFTAVPTFRSNTNSVVIYRHNRYKGDLTSILKEYTAKCEVCGWKMKLDGYSFQPRSLESDYVDGAKARNHRCPTLEEAMKPKTWEVL